MASDEERTEEADVTKVMVEDLEADQQGGERLRLDDFEIGEKIGVGGMGVVHRALEISLQRQVALKRLIHTPTGRAGRSQLQRFRLEARAAAQLDHDHIVPVYHIGQDGDTWFYTMKLIEGQTFARVIDNARDFLKQAGSAVRKSAVSRNGDTAGKKRASTVGGSSGGLALSSEIFVQSQSTQNSKAAEELAHSVAKVGVVVANALEHAHNNGVIHRDVKPSNLMLDQDYKVWLMDFGLAQLRDSPELTATGHVVGTLRYMSPEQASGRRQLIDHRTDIYSLGATLYELATLRRAHPGDSREDVLRSITFERPLPVHRINPRIPRDLSTIIEIAMERDPKNRYQNAGEMAEDLRRFLSGQAILKRPPGTVKRVIGWLLERPATAALILLSSTLSTIILVMVVVMLTIWLSGKTVALDESEAQREIVEQENKAVSKDLRASEANRLVAQGALSLEDDPGLSLSLINEASRLDADVPQANTWALRALEDYHEQKTVWFTDQPFALAEQIVLHPDNQHVLVTQSANEEAAGISAWFVDLKSGQVEEYLRSKHWIERAAFTVDGASLITSGKTGPLDFRPAEGVTKRPPPGPVVIWDTESWEPILTRSDLRADRLDQRAVSRRGDVVLLPNRQGGVVGLSTSDWESEKFLLLGHDQPVVQAIFSPSENRIATWSTDGTIGIWDGRRGERLKTIEVDVRRGWTADRLELTFSPDGQWVSLCGDLTSRFYRVDGEGPEWELPFSNMVFAADSQHAYAMPNFGSDREISIIHLETGEAYSRVKLETRIRDLLLLRDGKHLAASLIDGRIAMIDILSGEPLAFLRGHDDSVVAMAAPGSQGDLLSASYDGSLRRWSTVSDQAQRMIELQLINSVSSFLSPSKDGKFIAGGPVLRPISAMWSTTDWEPIAEIPLTGLGLLSDGTLMAREDTRVSVWNMRRRQQQSAKSIAQDEVTRVIEFSSPEDLVLDTGNAGVYRWNTRTGTLRQIMSQTEAPEHFLKLPEGGSILLGYEDGRIGLLDADGGQRVVGKVPGRPASLQLHPDQKRVLIGSDSHQLYEWSIDDEALAMVLEAPAGTRLGEAYYRPSEGQIVTSDYAARFKIWNGETGEEQDSFALAEEDQRGFLFSTMHPTAGRVIVAGESGVFVIQFETGEVQRLLTTSCTDAVWLDDLIVLTLEPGPSNNAGSNDDAGSNDGGGAAADGADAAGSRSSQLVVLDAETYEERSRRALDFYVNEMQHDPTRNTLLLRGRARGSEAFVAASRAKYARGGNAWSALKCLGMSADDALIAVYYWGAVRRSEGGLSEPTTLLDLKTNVVDATMSHDGELLLIVTETGESWLVGLRDETAEQVNGTFTPKTRHHFAADNIHVISTDGSAEVTIWDVRTGTTKATTFPGPVSHCVVSPGASRVVAMRDPERGAYGGTFVAVSDPQAPEAYLWDFEKEIIQPLESERQLKSVQWLDGGKQLVFLDRDGDLYRLAVDSTKLAADDSASGDNTAVPLQPFKLGRRFTALLGTASEGTRVLALSEDRVAVLDLAHPADSTDLDWSFAVEPVTLSYRISPQRWQSFSDVDAEWMLVPSGRDVLRVPIDPMAYVRKLGTRALSVGEQGRYITAELERARGIAAPTEQ